MELTKKQIERQDYVDNEIFKLINNINPTSNLLSWDIEIISEVRDVIQEIIVKRTKCSEQDFYPYIEE